MYVCMFTMIIISVLYYIVCVLSIKTYLLVISLCRDIVEVRMDLGGVPCIIRDTAGVRAEESADEIEREGMRRAR